VNNLLSMASRLLMALIFIVSGWNKLVAYSATEEYFSSLGIPLVALVTPLVILVELGGGLALLTGYKTRWAAAAIAAFTICAALVAHSNFSDPSQAINFLKNLAIAGGLLLFVKYGAGSASVDERKAK
jgi:putative oxidoreductase